MQSERYLAAPFATDAEKDEDTRGKTDLRAIAQIEAGLSVLALDRLAEMVAPDDIGFKFRIVPKATYSRRKKTQRLSAGESEHVARIARLWVFACAVWGSEVEAREFMFRPHPMLGDRRPVDLSISSELGSRLVEDILGGLAYGSAA